MGKDIRQSQFTLQDYKHFQQCLYENLQAFRRLLTQPGFGHGGTSFGAELELYIIDKMAKPMPISREIYTQIKDKNLSLELTRFNLEYNFTPIQDEKSPYTKMCQQMDKALQYLSRFVEGKQARILPIGILPTLQAEDVGHSSITQTPRYQCLAKILREKRGADFHIHIDGVESLDLRCHDVSLEGANTSFQFHYRVNPENFADAYNAAQLSTPLALALSANSPIFLGKKLWHETRIALFKQATDYRIEDTLDKQLPARVFFGMGWVRKDIYELFAESVYLFDPILPICSKINSFNELSSAKAPSLNELRLHLGTIWNWNRPIYDPVNNGHLRIELRALPAGPTPCNMVASAALMSGLISGLQDNLSTLLPGIPFHYAKQNFYRAAKYGLHAKLFWPNLRSNRLEERPVIKILSDLLPVAEQGLYQLECEDKEIKKQISIIKGGLETQMNGAQWQINMFNKLLKTEDQNTALSQLVELYYKQYQTGKPVHEWSEQIC